MRLRHFLCGFPLATASSLLIIAVAVPLEENSNEAATLFSERDACNNKDCYRTNVHIPSALEKALRLHPPVATSVEGGDTESSEWWLEHEALLRSAWKEWDEKQYSTSEGVQQQQMLLPRLDISLIDPELRSSMERTRNSPTLEHEAAVLGDWDEVLSSTNLHRVYRYKNFLTSEGIRKLRSHLDALSGNAIPKRRPNAMNRNGLLLDPSVPGGISGDPDLQNFVEVLSSDFLRPLGRSLFPEFAGDARDDAKHYAFTIKYGSEQEASKILPSSNSTTTSSSSTTSSSTTSADWDLKEHSDASVYTLNINLNLPDEGYSGSSLYFLTPEKRHHESKNNSTTTATTTNNEKFEISFEPGTALLHRGMTKHGARPLEGGKRNNLVIWLHGMDGYVRVAPYEKEERLSVQERWSSASREGPPTAEGASSSSFPTSTIFPKNGNVDSPAGAFEL